MKTRAIDSVIQVLRNARHDGLLGVTVTTIAIMTGYPEPSVRRTIGELKSYGWDIQREGRLVRLA